MITTKIPYRGSNAYDRRSMNRLNYNNRRNKVPVRRVPRCIRSMLSLVRCTGKSTGGAI